MHILSFIDHAPYQTHTEFLKPNPFTHETLHSVGSCDLLGLITAIQSSNRAFAEWKLSSHDERRALLTRIEKVLYEHQSKYAALEATDQALPVKFLLKNSIQIALQVLQRVKNEVPASELQFSPVGVVAIVGSWNFSLRIIMERLLPALMAGNAAVVKVSGQSPVTAMILAEILEAAQTPRGLVNVIVSDEIEVKRALVSHPGIRAVSICGRLETALDCLPLINRTSLQNFKKIQISSGSKNSAVVLGEPNENFEPVMESFMRGQGQLAWNSARLFILEKHEQAWDEKIREYLGGLKPSEGIEDSSLWTPCLKLSSFEKFGEIKKLAVEDKATLLEAPPSSKKSFLPPVFTKDMSRCSTLQQDQIHSPFFILSTVKYPFDVAKYSNVSYFGFASHLWGEPEKLGKLSEALDVGLVTYNKSSWLEPGAITAVKQSGFGLQDFQSFGSFFSNVKKLA